MMLPTSKKMWLVFILGISIVVVIGWNIGIRWHSEKLARTLINEFHQRYNSDADDHQSEYGLLDKERIRSAHKVLGRFSALKRCAVRRYSEPPWIEAQCRSSFQNADADEFFILQDYRGDSHLILYSVKVNEGGVVEIR